MADKEFHTMFGSFNRDDMQDGNELVEFDGVAKRTTTLIGYFARKLFRFEERRWKELYHEEVKAHVETKKYNRPMERIKELQVKVNNLQKLNNELYGLNEKLKMRSDALNEEGLHRKLEELRDKHINYVQKLFHGANETFLAHWDATENELAFSDDLLTSDPTLSTLIRADLELDDGDTAAAEFGNGVKALVQATPWGNIVTYQEAHTEEFYGEKVTYTAIHANAPKTITDLLPLVDATMGGVSQHTLELIFQPTAEGTWGRRMHTHLASEVSQIIKLENLVEKN
jgi:hypothetical protein